MHGVGDSEPLVTPAAPSVHKWYSGLWSTKASLWRGVALGQVISLLVSGTGVCSQYLSSNNVNIPTSQNTINYFLLSTLLLYKFIRDGRFKLNVPVWKYAILALADVEANYFVVKAYQYTNITSVMLLDCFTIPCVMVLSRMFLKTKYTIRHLIGIIVCVGGLVLAVIADVDSNSSSNHSRADIILGDSLCLLGSLCYSISNVGEEAAVKRFDISEFLGMLGCCGLVINTLQLIILERHELSSVKWNVEVGTAFVGYSACLFTMYALTALFMSKCDATVFNLTMLTSDGWGALWSVVLFHHPLSWLYFVSVAVVVCGVVCYNLAGLTSSNSDTGHSTSDSHATSTSTAIVPTTPSSPLMEGVGNDQLDAVVSGRYGEESERLYVPGSRQSLDIDTIVIDASADELK